MNASDKLRAFLARDDWPESLPLEELLAVVEAAQGTGWPVPDRKRLDAALAALDEALS